MDPTRAHLPGHVQAQAGEAGDGHGADHQGGAAGTDDEQLEDAEEPTGDDEGDGDGGGDGPLAGEHERS
jgi:hypothetical protein